MMRPVTAALAALCLLGCTARAQTTGAVRVDAAPVALDPSDPADIRRGDFVFAGGAQLTSPDTAQLGGLSDLTVAADGTVTAISDDGQRLDARLSLSPDGRLLGLKDARLQPLRGPGGQPLQGKQAGDAEGLAVWPNGDVMVSFERDHRIWLYPADGAAPRAVPFPPVAMPENEGMEALALAPSHGPDAYWVGIEGGAIWLCRLSGGCQEDPSQARPPLTYRLTALAETPDGKLVVLHRAWDPFRGLRAQVLVTQPTAGGPARVLGRLALAQPLTADNFEGLAVRPTAAGGLRIYLLSDDNFSPTQRTLLMAFDWTPRSVRPGAGPGSGTETAPAGSPSRH